MKENKRWWMSQISGLIRCMIKKGIVYHYNSDFLSILATFEYSGKQ
jgi:hypothetical protein